MKSEYGTIVKSLAGHDKNEYFVLIDIDDKYVYIVDGKSRTIEKPKKKNRKHVQFTHENIFYESNESESKKPVKNELIKKKIKEYKNRTKG